MASLRYGDKGEAVKEIQRKLKELGYFDGDIGGNYLNKTEAAVKAFQAANDLTADGIFGEKTRAKLFGEEAQESTDSTTTLVKGARGEAVKKVQQRLKDLGYLYDTVDGIFGSNTEAAIEEFQSTVKLTITGKCDTVTYDKLFAADAPKCEKKWKEGSTCEPAHGTAKKMDWWKSDIRKIFPRGAVATITDVKTGISWREQRKGGTNHADIQPCTAADTAAFKKACKSWSWARRAVFVTIKGVNYAASINCQPHGQGSIKNNNFNGHHCCHFTNSRTHCSNKVCPKHKNAIETAAKTTLP